MTAKTADRLIEDAASLVGKMRLCAIAKQVGVAPHILSKRLREKGISIPHKGFGANNYIALPIDVISARYESGETTVSIAADFGVDRLTIVKRLRKKGIVLRTASDCMRLRMSHTPIEIKRVWIENSRAKRAENMRACVLSGKPNPAIGEGEREMLEALTNRGYSVIPQDVFEGYLIDLSIGNIAIEIKTKGRQDFSEGGIRLKKLLEGGKRVFFVGFKSAACIAPCLDEVITHIERACGLPSVQGEYWVIRCYAEHSPGEIDSYHVTAVRNTPQFL